MVVFSPQAQIAIRSLLPSDRKRVERQISMLERFPDDTRGNVKRLKGAGNLYIMRATNTLRVLFRPTNGTIEVVDVFTHDRLKSMHRYAG